eukprot:2493628-Alexandrium_andersonii.AAC.1
MPATPRSSRSLPRKTLMQTPTPWRSSRLRGKAGPRTERALRLPSVVSCEAPRMSSTLTRIESPFRTPPLIRWRKT